MELLPIGLTWGLEGNPNVGLSDEKSDSRQVTTSQTADRPSSGRQ